MVSGGIATARDVQGHHGYANPYDMTSSASVQHYAAYHPNAQPMPSSSYGGYNIYAPVYYNPHQQFQHFPIYQHYPAPQPTISAQPQVQYPLGYRQANQPSTRDTMPPNYTGPSACYAVYTPDPVQLSPSETSSSSTTTYEGTAAAAPSSSSLSSSKTGPPSSVVERHTTTTRDVEQRDGGASNLAGAKRTRPSAFVSCENPSRTKLISEQQAIQGLVMMSDATLNNPKETAVVAGDEVSGGISASLQAPPTHVKMEQDGNRNLEDTKVAHTTGLTNECRIYYFPVTAKNDGTFILKNSPDSRAQWNHRAVADENRDDGTSLSNEKCQDKPQIHRRVTNKRIGGSKGTVTMHACPHEGCSYMTKEKNNLKRHLAAVHEQNIKWHVCPHKTCSYRAKQKGHLNRHLAGVHGENPTWFHCPHPHCSHKAKQKTDLNRHIHSVHSVLLSSKNKK